MYFYLCVYAIEINFLLKNILSTFGMDFNELLNEVKNSTDHEAIYDILIKKYPIEILDYYFYTIHNFIVDNTENKSLKEKRADYKFCQDVIKRDVNCIVTGRSILVCEVAHIFKYADSNIHEKYDVNNGMLLCRDLHALYDNGHIMIDKNIVAFDDVVMNDNSLADYHKYNNIQINLPKECNKYINKCK